MYATSREPLALRRGKSVGGFMNSHRLSLPENLFRNGFTDRLLGSATQCEFMQSDGGLTHFEKYENLITVS